MVFKISQSCIKLFAMFWIFYGEILCPPGTGTRQVSAASSRSATSLALLVVVGDC